MISIKLNKFTTKRLLCYNKLLQVQNSAEYREFHQAWSDHLHVFFFSFGLICMYWQSNLIDLKLTPFKGWILNPLFFNLAKRNLTPTDWLKRYWQETKQKKKNQLGVETQPKKVLFTPYDPDSKTPLKRLKEVHKMPRRRHFNRIRLFSAYPNTCSQETQARTDMNLDEAAASQIQPQICDISGSISIGQLKVRLFHFFWQNSGNVACSWKKQMLLWVFVSLDNHLQVYLV